MKPFYASKTPKELRDCWGTPQWLIDDLKTEFHFTLDAAADPYNAKFPRHLTDGLAFNWSEVCEQGDWAWCNPPFSEVTPWVDQWIASAEAGVGVVAIVNNQSGAKWWHKAMDAATELRFSLGRVAFIHPVTGRPINDNNMGQVIFVFEPGDLGAQRLAHFKASR